MDFNGVSPKMFVLQCVRSKIQATISGAKITLAHYRPDADAFGSWSECHSTGRHFLCSFEDSSPFDRIRNCRACSLDPVNSIQWTLSTEHCPLNRIQRTRFTIARLPFLFSWLMGKKKRHTACVLLSSWSRWTHLPSWRWNFISSNCSVI